MFSPDRLRIQGLHVWSSVGNRDAAATRSLRVSLIVGFLACIELGAVLAVGCNRMFRIIPEHEPGAATRIARMSSAPREFHVDPAGRHDNDGSVDRPLDLATALSKNSPARPGDTIWLHNGIYRGNFVSHLTGASGAPIVVRQFPGERATIDSNPSSREALQALGSWTWFWGFEIMNSNPKRRTEQRGSWPDDLARGPGVTARGTYLKFINMVVHDMSEGLEIWEEAIGTEAHGNLIFYNGWGGPDRGHGHGIYTQNAAPFRVIRDNIIFNQFSHGIHAYGSQRASLDNIRLEGNIAFNNGAPVDDFARDILLGGGRVALNPVLKDNSTYGRAETNVGYAAGCANGAVTGNYFAQRVLVVDKCQAAVTDNVFLDHPDNRALRERFRANTYQVGRANETVVRLRRNAHEPGRANLVVYNWDRLPSLSVDVRAACRARDDRFEIRDVQNFFGPAVAAGQCGGENVTLRLTKLRVASPIGEFPTPPAHTAPEFAAFVVLPVVSTN